ncbi:MAG TPA: FAD-binding oxidoreductase [Pyrinomonadaceae bacterium]|jgi:sarcosine oxidase subunit beta
MQSAEVVIIGAGVIGASIAYHLARKGCTDVLVLERGTGPGQGSTGRATGGFRAQFSTPVNIHLSLLSREKLKSFAAEHRIDSVYNPCGYLFLARQQEELDALYAAQEVQRANGLHEAVRVNLAEVERLNPAVQAGELAGGVFCPTDGFIRPLQILRGYTESAARLGVRFVYGLTQTGFRLKGPERIAAVKTSAEEIAAGCVVNAAGAWAAQVAEQAGISLPVKPLRRQVAQTYPTSLLPEEMPMTIFVEDGFHLRVRDGRVLLLWPDQPEVEDPFEQEVTDEWIAEVVSLAHARVPALREAAIDRRSCWAGLYEMSPDRHALLGLAPGMENFYLANGSSGHGVMHAPALGQLLAEIILDGAAHTLDVHALRPSRFIEGQPNSASEFL